MATTLRQGRVAAQDRGRRRTRPACGLLGPDGKSLYVVCGNDTKMIEAGRVARAAVLGRRSPAAAACPTATASWPVGWARAAASTASIPMARTGSWSAIGYRNVFDAAFNRDGELFTYDADMEWDMNTPWYRPTRVCLATSGSEFGWRNGAGKWPPYYPDNLPAVLNVGPGSPTGIDLRLRRQVPGQVSGSPVHLRLELRQTLRRSFDAGTARLQGRTGGVRQRVAAAADRRRYQPEGRRHVLHHRRPQYAIGSLSHHLRRQGIDRSGAAAGAGAESARLRHRLEAFHGKQDPEGR